MTFLFLVLVLLFFVLLLFFFGFGFIVFCFIIIFFNRVLTWKIIEASKDLVIYIYRLLLI